MNKMCKVLQGYIIAEAGVIVVLIMNNVIHICRYFINVINNDR